MSGHCLILVAAPKEFDAVLRGLGGSTTGTPSLRDWRIHEAAEGVDLVLAGVGKANAAAAVARTFDATRHGRVLNLGVAGALPGGGLAMGDAVIATHCAYADEGSENPPPEGFVTIARMGFGPLAGICGPGSGMDTVVVPCAPLELAPLSAGRIARGMIATVSTCSGTDALAAEIVRRTGAIAEDMESAAIGFAVARLAPWMPFSTVRVISNSTGDRFKQTWNLTRALDRLAEVSRRLFATP
jgi:futalosine hydrolase